MKVRMTVAAVTLALGSAMAANAQVQPPQERINTALARAREVGIPVALLESKIAEGKAKGVSLDRIAIALERRQAALERANQAMRGQADAVASLAVAADAIESGVSENVLRAVADSAPRDRRNVAIAALTELVHQGQTPDAALQRVRDALKRGPDALANLPTEGSSNRGQGSSNSQGRGQGQGNQGQGNQGQGNQGQGNQGQGNSGRRAGADPGPPAGVPAPGQPPQSGRPDSSGQGGNQGGGQGGGSGGGQAGGSGNNQGGRGGGQPTNPGRGGQ